MTIDDFIKENIPDDVIWTEKVTNLVRLAYVLGKKHAVEEINEMNQLARKVYEENCS
jgi:hypothetical protein|tara:strand:- start:2369 stop:2539 length:171 start_codon:yes stop_codon:yes gene_type:complete